MIRSWSSASHTVFCCYRYHASLEEGVDRYSGARELRRMDLPPRLWVSEVEVKIGHRQGLMEFLVVEFHWG